MSRTGVSFQKGEVGERRWEAGIEEGVQSQRGRVGQVEGVKEEGGPFRGRCYCSSVGSV